MSSRCAQFCDATATVFLKQELFNRSTTYRSREDSKALFPHGKGRNNVAVLLAIPLFDGGQREGRISESRSLVQQEMFRLQTVVNKVNLEVREALVTLTSSREQIAIAQSGLQAAASELELARERFTILTRTSN